MKVLMLVPFPGIKGPIPKHTPHLVAALRQLGCQVETEPWGRHSDDESFQDKLAGRVQDVVRICQRLRRERFDVMVIKTAHDWATLSRDVTLVMAAGRLCPRIVIQFHGSAPDRVRQQGQTLFRAATSRLISGSDAALVLSQEEQMQWQECYPNARFYTVSNPFVPPKATTGESVALPWKVPSSTPVLLFCGRLIPEKGIFDLLHAMHAIVQQTNCHLAVLGDGPESGRVRQCVSELRLNDHVTLAGYITGDQLWAAYRGATVFVLPTYWKEGFPTVITEAMHAGLPIVTTRIRGAADLLTEGTNALFVPPRDPATLARTVTRLLDDRDLCAAMSTANRQKVKEFAPLAVGRRYLDVLQAVVSSPPRSAPQAVIARGGVSR